MTIFRHRCFCLWAGTDLHFSLMRIFIHIWSGTPRWFIRRPLPILPPAWQEVKPTVGYWVQQLFGNNVGDEYIYSEIELSNRSDNVSKRIAKSIVRDSKTGDIIVKIVNLLPVELNTTLDMSEFNIANETVEISVLTGAPDDRDAKPITRALKFEEQNTLPPYSLTIFRFNTIQ